MDMRKLAIAAAMVLVLIGSTAGVAGAEVTKSASADVALMSNYVWRGLRLSDSWVMQPSLSVGVGSAEVGDFGANMWSSYDGSLDMGEPEGDTGKVTETDITLSYSKSFDKIGLGAGYIYYELEGYQDTQELYVSASYDFIVSPSLTVYYDFDEGTGGYAVFALGYSREIEKLTVDAGVSVSYLFDNLVVGVDAEGEEYSDLHSGEVSLGLGYAVNDMVSVGAKAAYSFPLSDDAEDAIEGYSYDGESDTFYGGLTAGLSF